MAKKPGDVIKFITEKQYTYQRNIGQGGTGKTILIKDEITGMNFVCKKYSPYDTTKQKEYFERFIDEIKIMYLLSHKNIVRIYNYFLYPEYSTGYILMENIEGDTINNYLRFQDNEVFESVFIQLIEGFEYLESNNVLHRDVRNANILVTNEGIVKIIDFGFGKKIEFKTQESASILLNWPVTELPDEIRKQKYNHQTELYFVGKLFNKILKENNISDFKYQEIIDRMIIVDSEKRIKSFNEIIQYISKEVFSEIEFTKEEKEIYTIFVEELISHINCVKNELTVIDDSKKIINSLEAVIEESLLEEVLQNNNDLISCFIDCAYNYKITKDIKIDSIKNFYKFFKGLTENKKNILVRNIISRLKTVKVEYDYDDMPF